MQALMLPFLLPVFVFFAVFNVVFFEMIIAPFPSIEVKERSNGLIYK